LSEFKKNNSGTQNSGSNLPVRPSANNEKPSNQNGAKEASGTSGNIKKRMF